MLHGGGDAPALGPTVRRAQGRRICHRLLPARRLAEGIASPPPKVLGRDTLRPSFASRTCGRGKARTPPPVSGSTTSRLIVIQPSRQAWGHSSWWSSRWGCGTLVVSTVFPLFCGPGPGVCQHLRGHSR